MSLERIDYKDLNFNPMTLFADEWLLLTAGTKDRGFNTMTIAWGHLGAIWKNSLPTSVVFVRPQRYTKQFIDKEDYYTISVFPKEYKKDLAYLGSHSGRDEDKLAKTNITPYFDEKTTWFNEAKLVMVCKKLYQAPILEENFIDKEIISKSYPLKDFHEMYVGEIVEVYVDKAKQ